MQRLSTRTAAVRCPFVVNDMKRIKPACRRLLPFGLATPATDIDRAQWKANKQLSRQLLTGHFSSSIVAIASDFIHRNGRPFAPFLWR